MSETNFTGGARSANLEAALAYAQAGRAVLPCKPSGKEPLTAHGVKDATCDAVQILEWWKRCPDANVAIATGKVSGIVVLDIDPRHGGAESLKELEAKFGKLPDTVTTITGGGGRHAYFRYPKGVEGIPNSAGALGPGLDVRADGGYVIAPPSMHPSGDEYQWPVQGALRLADIPKWLLALLSKPPTSTSTTGNGRFEVPLTIPEGERNETLYRLARSLRAKALGPEVIRAALEAENQASCKPPLDEDEVEQIVRNAASEPDRPDFRAADPEITRLAALPTIQYERSQGRSQAASDARERARCGGREAAPTQPERSESAACTARPRALG